MVESWFVTKISWLKMGRGGWSWVEADEAGWRWVHSLARPVNFLDFEF